jgi:hypothetical protein
MQLQKFAILSLFILTVFYVRSEDEFVVKPTPHSVSNWGLNFPPVVESLPKSKSKVVFPTRKEKKQVKTELNQISYNNYSLASGWEMAELSELFKSSQSVFNPAYNTNAWYNATVPGTVLTTLVEQDVYPDPYFGINNLFIPDSLCRKDWIYRIKFEIPEDQKGKTKWLKFDGINYRAIIWLNGENIGRIDGAFKREEFNITNIAKIDKENVLVVHIIPPPNPGYPQEQSPLTGRGTNGGQLCLDGPTFIASEGWDWMPGIRDRNIGIWQPVRLYFTESVKIYNPQIITNLPLLPDTTLANITVTAFVKNTSNISQLATVSGEIEGVTFENSVQLLAGEEKRIEFSHQNFKQLQIKNPRLWWPNGYGRQELYNLMLKATVNNTISDMQTVRFGIREFSYELSVDMPQKQNVRIEYNPLNDIKNGNPVFDNTQPRNTGGRLHVPRLQPGINPQDLKIIEDENMSSYLVVKVNGQRIYCRGGNWGMDDAMKRSSKQHLEPYFVLHKEANLNMVRNWTGESTQDSFFELCDEYGMLVWNDFWLSTENYNLPPNDHKLFLENALDVIIRYRNHPSIVVWNPRNEGYAPRSIEEKLNEYVASYDGTRLYQANSRYMNLSNSGPWSYFKNPVNYFSNNAKGFSTELGTPSIPTAETIRKMMAEKDAWPISDVWHYHDFHSGLVDYVYTIDSLYGVPVDLEDFSKKAQFLNYDSHRAMFEAWNSKLWNNTSGLLLWMTHPAWPSMVWQIYSSDGETFGSYYGSKKACEPIHAQYNLHDRKVIVINTTLKGMNKSKVNFTLYDLKGKKIYSEQLQKDIPANSVTEYFVPDLPEILPEVYLVRLILTNERGEEISLNDYWKTANINFYQFNQLKEIGLKAKRISSRQNDVLIFELTNNSLVPAIGVKLGLRNQDTNERILPSIFSDGYFTLLPKEKRRFTVKYDKLDPVVLTIEGYNVADQSFSVKMR